MEQTPTTSAGGTENAQTVNTILGTQTEATQHQTTVTTSVDNTPITKFNDLLSEDGKFVNDWTTKLPDGFNDYAKTLSKFKDPTALLSSYASLEKEFSKRTTVKIPDAATATDADWASYRQAIGAPDKKESYGLTRPDNIPENQWNAALADKTSEIALKYGIPTKAVHDLVDVYNENMKTLVQTGEQVQQEKYNESMNTLKQEWGTGFANNINKAVRAAKAIGLDVNDPTVGNNISVIKALLTVNSYLSEDKNMPAGMTKTDTYEEAYNSILKGPDYQGKNGIEKQAAAATKLKMLFDAMHGKV